jgi:hypothetical protein
MKRIDPRTKKLVHTRCVSGRGSVSGCGADPVVLVTESGWKTYREPATGIYKKRYGTV